RLVTIHTRYCLVSPFREHRTLHSFPTRRSSDLFDNHRVLLVADRADRGAVLARGVGLDGLFPEKDDRLSIGLPAGKPCRLMELQDRKSTRLNSSHQIISYAVFCLKKKK